MELRVIFSEDAGFVRRRAEEFLSSKAVEHNLILTILQARVAHPEPGRYWIALEDENTVVGAVMQSPLEYPAVLTPMAPPAVLAMVEAVAAAGIKLPGINGDAATAASFAGQWSERCKAAAIPFQGLRLYEYLGAEQAQAGQGHLRLAGPADRSQMILWTGAFQDEIGESASDVELRVDRALAAQQLWVWDEKGEIVSMAAGREPTQGVVRIAGVYTPPEKRKRGYAAACVNALSRHLRDSGYRCILYTDLGNPTSNSIYRRIGYRAVAESLRYRFE
jgi:uncharacterized protein